jgi:gliding motility-associated-like protein
MLKPIILSLLFLPIYAFAQLTVTLNVTNPDCSANGQIEVLVSGGSGNYTYTLEGDCGEFFPPQNNNIFTTLPPCDYTVTVNDDMGVSGTETATLTGNNGSFSVEIAFIDCALQIVTEGGTPPFEYSYSTNSNTGPWIPLGNSPDIPTGVDVPLWGRVIDNCGIPVIAAGSSTLGQITDFDQAQTSAGLMITAINGAGPFDYELNSSIGTFNNDTGLFPWAQVGCDPRITITSSCNGSTLTNRPVEIDVVGQYVCVRISEGFAEMSVIPGRAPFTFTVEIPGETFTSTTGVFNNLPPNELFYRFYVEDSCGEGDSDFFYEVTPYHLSFGALPEGCSPGSLELQVERYCTGRFDGPVEIECLSCPNGETVTQNFSFNYVELVGPLSPGEWELAFTDDCGDRVTCQDTVILEVITACDSLLVAIVDQFNCDNGIQDRRLIADTSAIYSLYDELGTLLEDNNRTGVFTGLPLGNYWVDAVSDCGLLTAEASLTEAVPINPFTEFFVAYDDNGFADCTLNYTLRIEKTQGPFVITGGPDNSFYRVLNNYGQDNCRWYILSNLLPGDYEIASMSACGTTTFTLPEVTFPTLDSVAVLNTCPGNSRIEIFAEDRSFTDWYNIFLNGGVEVENDQLSDRYYVNGRYYDSPIITGLSPGEHTVYLIPRFASTDCPVDSIVVNIPAYTPVELLVSGDIICDNSASSDLRLDIASGEGPYLVLEVNCAVPSQTIASYIVESDSTLVLVDKTTGIYCFVVIDDCGIATDYQVEVRPYSDEISVEYSCDPQLILSVDSLNATFSWLDEANNVISNTNILTIDPPSSDATYQLSVALPECTLERTITVPFRPVVPLLNTNFADGDTLIQCGTEEILLVGTTDSFSDLLWSTGSTSDSLLTSTPGLYTLTSVNDLGCSNEQTVYLDQFSLPIPQVQGNEGICTGDTTMLTYTANVEISEVLWGNTATADSILITEGGTYFLMVTDENGCAGEDSILIEQWLLPTPQWESDFLICPGAVTTLALTEPYNMYLWSTTETTSEITAAIGSYSVTVSDENACQSNIGINITAYSQYEVELLGDTTICQGDSADLQLSLSGGGFTIDSLILFDTENLIFTSYGGLLNVQSFSYTAEANSNLTVSEIFVADYDCPVILNGGANVMVNNLTAAVSLTPVSCAGQNDGAISVLPVSDYPPYDLSWNTGSNMLEISNLSPSWYYFTVTDVLGCSLVDSVQLTAPAPLMAQVSVVNPVCYGDANGIISLTEPFGGTAPYTISLLGDNGVESNSFENLELSAGAYELELRDANGCRLDSVISLIEPDPLFLSLGPDQRLTFGETFLAKPQHNLQEITTVIWNDTTGVERISTAEWELQPFSSFSYVLSLTDTAGCAVSDTINLLVDREISVYAPNIFSPNGDGINDEFQLFPNTEQVLAINNFAIYDRWGNGVWSATESGVSGAIQEWNGSYRGKNAQPGVFVWYAELTLIDGTTLNLQGDVVLIR